LGDRQRFPPERTEVMDVASQKAEARVVEVPKEVTDFIETVSERWGYYTAKRLIMGELMKATKDERAEVRQLGREVAEKIELFLNKPQKELREAIDSLRGRLAKVREVLREKSAPYYQRMRPLNKALSFLDKVVIPQQIETVTGKAVTPRYRVSKDILEAIKPKKKAKKKE